jgi:hypothetical protein
MVATLQAMRMAIFKAEVVDIAGFGEEAPSRANRRE